MQTYLGTSLSESILFPGETAYCCPGAGTDESLNAWLCPQEGFLQGVLFCFLTVYCLSILGPEAPSDDQGTK